MTLETIFVSVVVMMPVVILGWIGILVFRTWIDLKSSLPRKIWASILFLFLFIIELYYFISFFQPGLVGGVIRRSFNLNFNSVSTQGTGECDYERGEVQVGFDRKISEAEIEKLLMSLNLKLRLKIETYGSAEYQFARIKVPVGSEKEWVGRFKTYDHVKYASLNTFCPPPGM